MRRKLRVGLAALCCIGIVGGGLGAGVGTAKISPPSCTTGSGHTPPGQQPTCQGGGLDQNPATNPSGHAPPGQQ